MVGIIGIDVLFPYSNLEFVGTLLFAHYPTTLVYSDGTDNPIIKEWVDCNDDNTVDRYFYYKTTRVDLKKFVEGKQPHNDFINSSIESYVVFQDESNNEILRTYVVSLKSIPVSYKPSKDFYFNQDDGVDLIDVIEYFNLDEISLPELELKLVKDVSKLNNSETLYFHMNKGKGVGYGTVNTEVFAKTLLSFDKLYKNVALDYLKGVNRADIQIDAQANESVRKYTNTELFGVRVAASYGFMIRPLSPQIDLFNLKSETEDIAGIVFSLFEDSKDLEVFKSQYERYSGYTINAYKLFLEGIYKSEMSFDLNWYSPLNENEKVNRIDYRKATNIISNIEKITTTDRQEFKVKGKFRAVHCDTRHYSFVSTNNETYNGYFDKAIKEAAESVNFRDVYEITISRTIITAASKKDENVKDLIIACYKDFE